MNACPKCHHPVVGTAKFCQKCGASLTVETYPKNAEQATRRLPPAPPPKKKVMVKEPEVVVAQPRVEPSKKNPWLFLVFGGVVILALYGMFHPSDEAPAPHGYASIYMTDDLEGWGIGAGYQTQSEADSVTLKNCQDRNPGKTCTKKQGGAFKCGGIGISKKWVVWQLDDDLGRLKSTIISECKKNGARCKIKPDAQVCASW